MTKMGNTETKPKPKHNQRVFKILDNGGFPFKVVKKPGKKLAVYKQIIDDDYDVLGYEKEPFFVTPYEKLFIGCNKYPIYPTYGKEWYGNSVLVKLSPLKYIFIGWEIFSFTTVQEIVDYNSPVGNSGVSYPYAYTKDYVYFLLDHTHFKHPRSYYYMKKPEGIDVKTFDPYEELLWKYPSDPRKIPKDTLKRYKIKMIQKRL